MRVVIASDHAGFVLKSAITKALQRGEHEVLDLGTYGDQPVDYPDFAVLLGEALLDGRADRGILLCGSGVGACITANKIVGVYACLCHDTYSAHQGVEHDNMNVLCLGGRIVGEALAIEIVNAFLSAVFSQEGRHLRRVGKMLQVENRYKNGK